MGRLSKEDYQRKMMWAGRRMDENAEIPTLTAEQHETLAWLCGLRHKIHCSKEDLWNAESGPYADLWPKYDDINNRLSACGLKRIEELPDRLDIPEDYYYLVFMPEEERESWEQRAEKFNLENPNKLFKHCGLTLWMEETGIYFEYHKTMEHINTLIEHYLAEIDEEHGTKYCPSGATRNMDIL